MTGTGRRSAPFPGLTFFARMRLVLAVSCAALVAGCALVRPTPAAPVVALESSFGMCQGYCATRLAVSPDGVATFTETDRRGARPERVRSRALTPAERASLAEAVAASRVATETLGCPDCADGGAEVVELGDQRVTFEYAEDAGGASPLAEALREIRETFPRDPGNL